MNRQHYDHVTEHFSLKGRDLWWKATTDIIDISTIKISRGVANYNINARTTQGKVTFLYINILLHKQATEIVEYIKTTEVLFV